MRNAAKMKLFQPDMEKLRDEMDANPTKDGDSALEFQKKYKALMKKHDVNPMKSILAPLAQVRNSCLAFYLFKKCCADQRCVSVNVAVIRRSQFFLHFFGVCRTSQNTFLSMHTRELAGLLTFPPLTPLWRSP